MANQRMIVTIDFIPLPFILANLLKKKKKEKKNLPPSSSILLLLSLVLPKMVGVVLTRANEAVITISSHPNNMRTTFKFIAAFQSFFFLPFFLSFPFRNETHTRHLQRYFLEKKKNSP